jgi:RNA polymerase sigma-70 factor (ECF subfamily)
MILTRVAGPILAYKSWRQIPVVHHAADDDERDLLEALRAGDERAFVTLVERYHPGMIRLAQQYVRDRSAAEGVAQEAWLQILEGLERFEARSSLKTWIFGVVLNCARARARRDRRTVPFSVIAPTANDPFEPTVEPSRFRGSGDQYPGGWVSFPPSWGDAPDQRLLVTEARQYLQSAIDSLPPNQRVVVVLRDVQGLTAEQACSVLQLSAANQRVLLHRGRSRVRRAIEHYLVRE